MSKFSYELARETPTYNWPREKQFVRTSSFKSLTLVFVYCHF